MPRKKKSAAAREAANAAYGNAAAGTGKSQEGKLAQLLEFLPQLGQEAATILLHSHDYDVSAAVAAHVNGDGTLDEWSTNTSKPKPKKETHAKPTEANSGSDNSKGGNLKVLSKTTIAPAQPTKQRATEVLQAPQPKSNLKPQGVQHQGQKQQNARRTDGGDKGVTKHSQPAKSSVTSTPASRQPAAVVPQSGPVAASGMRKLDINTLMRNNPSTGGGGMIPSAASAALSGGKMALSAYTSVPQAIPAGLSPAAQEALKSLEELQKVTNEKVINAIQSNQALYSWTEAQNDSTTVLNTLQAEVNRRRIQLVQSMSLARSTEAALIQKRRNLLLTMAQSGLGDEQTAEMIQKFDEATRADLPKWRTKRFQHNVAEVQSAILACGSFVDVSAIPANTTVAVAPPAVSTHAPRGNNAKPSDKKTRSSSSNNSSTGAKKHADNVSQRNTENNSSQQTADGASAQPARAQRKPRQRKRDGKSAASTD